MTPTNRRRTHVVDPLQLRHVVLVVGCGAALAVAEGVRSYRAQLRVLEGAALEAAKRAALERSGEQMMWALGGFTVLAVLAVVLVGVVTARRLAGPTRVLTWFLDLLAEGRYPPPRALRRQDELKDFHAHFLRTVEAMKSRETEHLRRVDDALASMRNALPAAPHLMLAMRALEDDARERRRSLLEASPPQASAPPAPASAGALPD